MRSIIPSKDWYIPPMWTPRDEAFEIFKVYAKNFRVKISYNEETGKFVAYRKRDCNTDELTSMYIPEAIIHKDVLISILDDISEGRFYNKNALEDYETPCEVMNKKI